MLDPDYSVGELVIMGLKGFSLSAETIQTLTREKVTNYILFAHNYNADSGSAREQLIQLTDQIQSFAPTYGTRDPFLISVDQEGGRVQRFRKEFTLLPTAKAVGELKSPNLAFEIAQVQARELYAAGLQLNYAPVCDINTNPLNPVIGDRAYGDNLEIVNQMTSASVRGHLIENVQACVKHFPGHGDTHLDSHYALPTVTTPLETLRAREWVPFQKAVKSGCNFMMSAHLMLPHIDAERPGTLSSIFLKKYLREELRYEGVVVSDDMEMHAISKNYGADEAPVLALQAGCDLLCYRSEEHAVIAIEAIKKAVQDKKLSTDLLKVSIDRVRKIRKTLKLAKNHLSLNERLSLIGNADHAAVVQKKEA